MTNDLQQARISTEVLDEYRKIVAWLEAQAALRGAVGDTMHGLAAEALTELIEREYSRHMIPLYGMLDVWMATRGTSHPEFDQFYSEHGYAETWARLLADVRALAAADAHLPSMEQVQAEAWKEGYVAGFLKAMGDELGGSNREAVLPGLSTKENER